MSDADAKYLIVKRDLYYMPNACGYTGIRDEAGRYTLEQVAEYFPNLESENQDGMSFIHENDAPEFTKACFQDLKENHLIKQRDASIQRAEKAEASNARWQQNSRETWEAMQAMRGTINENLPMPSLESDLLQGPENSIFCATVAEAVINALTQARAEAAAAWEAGRDASLKSADKAERSIDHTPGGFVCAVSYIEALTPPADASASLQAVKDAEWNAAIDCFEKYLLSKIDALKWLSNKHRNNGDEDAACDALTEAMTLGEALKHIRALKRTTPERDGGK